MPQEVICAVDPGLSGAFCFYDGSKLELFDMPLSIVKRNGKMRRDVAYNQLPLILNQYRGIVKHAYVERVASLPKQGTSSTFAFGKATGAVLGAIAMIGAEIDEIPPQTWKRSLDLCGKEKDEARLLAIKLFPKEAEFFKRKKDGGRADSACLALYAWRMRN